MCRWLPTCSHSRLPTLIDRRSGCTLACCNFLTCGIGLRYCQSGVIRETPMVVLRPDAPHGNDRANRGMHDGQLRYQLIAPYNIRSTANVLRSHFLCSPIDGCVCVRRVARYPLDEMCHCGFLSCLRSIGASLSRYYYSRVGKGCQHLRHINFLHWFNHPPRHQRSTSPRATVAPVDTVTTAANVSTPHTNASHDTRTSGLHVPPVANSTWGNQ